MELETLFNKLEHLLCKLEAWLLSPTMHDPEDSWEKHLYITGWSPQKINIEC